MIQFELKRFQSIKNKKSGLEKKAFVSYIWLGKAVHLQIFKKIICERLCVSQCEHIRQKQKNNCK